MSETCSWVPSRRRSPQASIVRRHIGAVGFDQGQQGADFPGTPHDWQFLAVPGPNEVEDRPWSLPGDLIKKPDPLEVDTEGTLRDLLLMEQEQEILADVLFAELVRSAPVVLGER